MDTGASHHMTVDINSLTQVQPFEGFNKIIIGNGSELSIKNIGFKSLNTKSYSLVLKNVLQMAKIAKSLLSVKQLCVDNASWFICDETRFFVQDEKTREILYQGNSRPQELFHIPIVHQSQGLQSVYQNSGAFLG